MSAVTVNDRDWFSWEGTARIRADCEQVAVNEGLSGIQLFFRTQELFSDCIRRKPTYRERQAKWQAKQLAKHPVSIATTCELTAQEVEYLKERLLGVNDPIGQDIVRKLTY